MSAWLQFDRFRKDLTARVERPEPGFARGMGEPAPPERPLRMLVNETEREFLDMLKRRRPEAKSLRHGWPDFLIVEPSGAFAVEVKSALDTLRKSQRRMFAALERIGIRVMIWSPERPDALVPWRRFWKERGGNADAAVSEAPEQRAHARGSDRGADR